MNYVIVWSDDRLAHHGVKGHDFIERMFNEQG